MNEMPTPKKDNTFCYYPFYALVCKLYENNELTHVAPCCMMHDTNHNSILTKEEIQGLTPEEIFHHPKFEELRKNMLNNVKDEHCATCWNMEEKNLKSFRLYGVWPFKGEQFYPKLREMDLSLSNKCNLACRMCNVGSSHQLLKDVNELKKNGTYMAFNDSSSGGMISDVNQMTKSDKNKQLKWIYENTDKVKTLKISGGEPLYDENVINLLKKYISDDNAKDTVLNFHTNLTLINDEIIELMNKFKYQIHTFSVDGTEGVYNYVRHLSDFRTVDDNLNNWLNKSTNIKSVNFNFVLSSLNLLNIQSYLQWILLSLSNRFDCMVFFSGVRPYKRGIDIVNLPKQFLMETLDNLNKFLIQFDSMKSDRLYYQKTNIIGMIENAIEKNEYEKGKFKLFSEISLLDKVRKQSYTDFLDEKMVKFLDHLSMEYNNKEKQKVIESSINNLEHRELQYYTSLILSKHEATSKFIKQFSANHDSVQFYKNVIKWFMLKYDMHPSELKNDNVQFRF